jgi:hypothetical protein
MVTEDGKTRIIRNPISLNHLSLMEYRQDLDLEFIVLFEKLLVFYRSSRLLPFYYQQDRFMEDLFIAYTSEDA